MVDIVTQIGYFADATDDEPAHNPCSEAPCCVCGKANGANGLTWRSVMPMRGRRSYFFAFHTACKQEREAIDAFEQKVMDEVFDWDEAVQETAK